MVESGDWVCLVPCASLQWRLASPHPRGLWLCSSLQKKQVQLLGDSFVPATCLPAGLGEPSHTLGRCFCWNQPLAGSGV